MMKIAKPIIIDNSMKGFEGGCRVYEDTVPTLTSREYKEPRCVGVAVDDASFIDFQIGGGIQMTDKARCLQSRYQKGYSKHKAEVSGVAIPVLTPDRIEKRQNGRRMKEDGEPAFTLTAQDRHGVAIGIDDLYAGRKPRFTVGRAPTLRGERSGVKVAVRVVPERQEHLGVYVELPNGVKAYAVWYEKNQCYIVVRKLTPRECFRLQGWTDDYFEKAQFVNLDSQLYKQAGNGVTVPVVRAVAERLK